jgi:hypothetical protein
VSSQTGDTGPSSGLKWFIGVVISLLAAGGGIVALLTYFHPTSAPPSAHPQADVIVCLTDARYAPDPNPAPDHGVVDPVYLHTTFNLRNKGSAQATVTDIFIDYLGIYLSNGQSVHTTRTYKLNSPLTIAGNGEVPGMMVDQLVGQRSENKLESATTQVFWEGGGTGRILHPTFDGVSWQNDPACSS